MPSSSTASNFTCWMCKLYTITRLSRASICSYRSTKLILSASSSSSFANSNAAVFSSSWLKVLSHSSECSSSSSAWEVSNTYSNSSLIVSAGCPSSAIAAPTSATQISASSWENGRNIPIPPIIRKLLRSSPSVSFIF
jgi:hypothetical protein